MRRHNGLLLHRQRILLPPQARHRLPLRIKIEAGLAVEVIRAPTGHAFLISCKTEHGQRHRDGDVDAQLADVEVFLELRGRAAGAGKDGGAVAVGVRVDQVDGRGDGVDVEGDEDRAEDLFRVAFHVRLHVGYYCGGDLGLVSMIDGWGGEDKGSGCQCLPSFHWGIFRVYILCHPIISLLPLPLRSLSDFQFAAGFEVI